jgi:hypothetical protein
MIFLISSKKNNANITSHANIYPMTTLSIRQLTYLILIAITIFAIITFYPSEQSYWVVWAGLPFALISLGKNFTQRLEAICLTALGCLFVVWIAEFASAFFVTLAAFLFVITTGLVYLAERYPLYAYPIFIINLFAFLASYSPSYVGGSGEKIVTICLGVVIVIFYQFIFLYRYQRYKWLSNAQAALNNLRKMNQVIFSCLLQPEYADNLYIFERRLHAQKEKFMQSMVLLSTLKKSSLQTTITQKFNLLYDTMLSYAQLRRRMSDYSALGVCADELNAISNEIDQLIVKVQKGISKNKFDFNVQPLLSAIQSLEDNYQQVLQVATKEPLMIVLFMTSLRAFAEEITNVD